MSETPVKVEITERKDEGWLAKLRRAVQRGTPQSILKESDRFSHLGYLKYPERVSRELRMFGLITILEDIEKEFQKVQEQQAEGKELRKHAYSNIRRLFRAFMTLGGPWFRGLDNRELCGKAVAFFELEVMVGHLPAFYPDLKLCTETLIHLSWQAIDMGPETPVLFESKAIIQPQGERINLESEVKSY